MSTEVISLESRVTQGYEMESAFTDEVHIASPLTMAAGLTSIVTQTSRMASNIELEDA